MNETDETIDMLQRLIAEFRNGSFVVTTHWVDREYYYTETEGGTELKQVSAGDFTLTLMYAEKRKEKESGGDDEAATTIRPADKPPC